MFEVGTVYRISMLKDSPEGPKEEHYFAQKVVEIDEGLIKVNEGWIINTRSLYFVWAKPEDTI